MGTPALQCRCESLRLVYRLALWVILSLITLVLVGCKSAEPEILSFVTLSQGEDFQPGRSFSEKEPDFLVIAAPGEIESPGLDVQFPASTAEELLAVDYEQDLVVVLLRGYIAARSPKYTIDVLQITRAGKEVIFQTHLGLPGPGDLTQSATSSPYHIISIAKEGRWGRAMHFVLQVDGEEKAALIRDIP